MRWRFLKQITELEPGKRAVGVAHTDLPTELFADHFPSFPVTPGVLLIEMGAQLAGRLVEATGLETRGHWVYPALIMVRSAKFLGFVPPRAELELVANLEAMGPDTADTRVVLRRSGKRLVSMRLVFGFDPEGRLERGDPEAIEDYEIAEMVRLGSPWVPRRTRSSNEG